MRKLLKTFGKLASPGVRNDLFRTMGIPAAWLILFHLAPLGREIESALSLPVEEALGWLSPADPLAKPVVRLLISTAFFTLICCTIGTLLGRLKTAPMASSLVGGIVLLLALGTYGSVYSPVDVPWLFCSVSMGVCAWMTRTLIAEKRQRLEDAFEGIVAPAKLESMLENLPEVSVIPTSVVVTVMYVDIVGFSIAAERETPNKAFVDLRGLIRPIAKLVHTHGGIVQRVFGDGMFCFFGCEYDGTAPTRDHADEALLCAIELQRHIVESALQAKGKSIFPVRIGIDTVSAFIGDLKLTQRIEMAVLGRDIAYAKTLASVCDPFGILLAPSSRDILVELDSMRPILQKRMVQANTSDVLVDAYSCDPFRDNEAKIKEVIAAYRKFAVLQRKDNRWAIPSGIEIRVTSPSVQGTMTNFSENGIGARLNQFLATGTIVRLGFESSDGVLGKQLALKGLSEVVCEVRWARPGESGFEHGLLIKSLTVEQKQFFVEQLRDCLNYAKAA